MMFVTGVAEVLHTFRASPKDTTTAKKGRVHPTDQSVVSREQKLTSLDRCYLSMLMLMLMLMLKLMLAD